MPAAATVAPSAAPPFGASLLPASHRIGAGGAERAIPRREVRLPGGRSIAYAETGQGPPLVAVHGTLMTLEDMWLGPVPALARRFRVIAVDRPGHGFSERVRHRDASVWRQAELIHEAVREIGLERPLILGHSFGGAVALAYGMNYPDETAGVVALSPVCFPEGVRVEQMLFGPRALPLGGGTLSGWLGRLSDPTLLPLLWNAMFLPQTMPEAFAGAFPFGLAGRPEQMVAEGEDALGLIAGLGRNMTGYPFCRVPVHIMAGSADLVVNPLTQGRLAARMIPGARFDWVRGAGHMLHHVHGEAIADAAEGLRVGARPD